MKPRASSYGMKVAIYTHPWIIGSYTNVGTRSHNVEQVGYCSRSQVDGKYVIFGGIAVVFAGDPRQLLPVVRYGDMKAQLRHSIFRWCLWPQVREVG